MFNINSKHGSKSVDEILHAVFPEDERSLNLNYEAQFWKHTALHFVFLIEEFFLRG